MARKNGFWMKLLILFLITSFSMEFIAGANIGISPASIEFDSVLRNGYSEKHIVISVDANKFVDVTIEPRGEIADWLNFSEMNFSVSSSEPHVLKISINPPSDIPNGDYSGILRVMTSELGSGVEGHAVGIVRSALDLLIETSVTDVEVIRCSASGLRIDSAEEGDDVLLSMDVTNNGNVRIKPHVRVDVWDQDQISVIKSEDFIERNILPTTTGSLDFRLSSEDLDIGQYWSEVFIEECLQSETLTFDVLEEGALKAEGVLLGIISRETAEVGETTPLVAKFQNTGEKEVEAQFRGKITLGDKIVQVLEGEKVRVPMSDETDFNFYFTPRKTGRHVVSGRVFYSSKRTFESSEVLEVISGDLFSGRLAILLVYVFLVILILFLFYKIRKERVSYSSTLRRLKDEFS